MGATMNRITFIVGGDVDGEGDGAERPRSPSPMSWRTAGTEATLVHPETLNESRPVSPSSSVPAWALGNTLTVPSTGGLK